MRTLILILTFILITINQLSAQASIKPVSPPFVIGNFGNSFAVDIVVGDPNPVIDLFSAHFTLTFTNTTYLTYNGIQAGNFLGGSPFIFAEPSSDRVSIAITSIPSIGPSSGSGVLAKVFFRITGTVPTQTENYFNIIKALGYKQNGDTIRFYPQESSLIIQSATSVDDLFVDLKFSLDQNFPNPFNPETNISFLLPKECDVNLIIYDLMGNEVVTLINNKLPSGRHTVKFNSTDYNLSSGVYVYKLKTSEFTSARKMVLLK